MSPEDALALIRKSPRFYVYLLRCDRGVPFYVGKGSGERVMQHIRSAKAGKHGTKSAIIRRAWSRGSDVSIEIDSFHEDEATAYVREAMLVREIGRRDLSTGPLTNRSDGGKGPINAAANAELRAFRSEKAKAFWASQENREHQSAKSKAMWSENQFRSKMVKKRAAAEYRGKQSEAQQARWNDSEYRQSAEQKLAAARKSIGDHAANAASAWRDDAKRALMLAVMRSPDHRAVRSANMARRWERQRELEQKCVEAMRTNPSPVTLPSRSASLAKWEQCFAALTTS